MNRYAFALVLSVVCGACSFSSSCGKKSVKADELEGDLKARVTALGLTPTGVDCPDGVEAKVGVSFTCKVAFGADSHDLVVSVSAIDEKAARATFDTKWAEGMGVVAPKLAEAITTRFTESFGAGVVVSCGDNLRFIVDKALPCDISSGAYQGKIKAVYDDKDVLQDVTFDDKLLGKKPLETLLLPSLHEQLGAQTTVDCGDQALLPRPADGALWCDISDGTKAAKIRVEIDEQLNVTRWAVAEPPAVPAPAP